MWIDAYVLSRFRFERFLCMRDNNGTSLLSVFAAFMPDSFFGYVCYCNRSYMKAVDNGCGQ